MERQLPARYVPLIDIGRIYIFEVHSSDLIGCRVLHQACRYIVRRSK